MQRADRKTVVELDAPTFETIGPDIDERGIQGAAARHSAGRHLGDQQAAVVGDEHHAGPAAGRRQRGPGGQQRVQRAVGRRPLQLDARGRRDQQTHVVVDATAV